MGVAPNTVKKYIRILESLFVIFRVTPCSRNIARSIIKIPKIYFYDTGLVNGDEGARFENMAALINFSRSYEIPATQLVLHLKQERMDRGVAIRRGMDFLTSLDF